MVTKSVFTNLIRAMEGIHDLEEIILDLLGCRPGAEGDSALGRLCSVETAVMEILGSEDADTLLEIVGSDMDLDQKVDLLLRLYSVNQ